ncbi:hypothetical protein POPTR_012G026150v4 [Populus trichocarpa]|uniref:Uncharacterized protein n=1 Tax=Populus trichocarpa TaxID=3694 RepID=A0A3N7FT00_POPTR|nr:hypothetical protein POPTR_012G026150v4 [Populus trichocarpa]
MVSIFPSNRCHPFFLLSHRRSLSVSLPHTLPSWPLQLKQPTSTSYRAAVPTQLLFPLSCRSKGRTEWRPSSLLTSLQQQRLLITAPPSLAPSPRTATPNRDPAPPYQRILFSFGLLVASFFG